MEGIYFSGVNQSSKEWLESAYGHQIKASNPVHAGPGSRNSKGRPNSLDGRRLGELLSVYYTRPYSLRRIADIFGVSRMTVWRAVQANQTIGPLG